jgi:hypothetical protein
MHLVDVLAAGGAIAPAQTSAVRALPFSVHLRRALFRQLSVGGAIVVEIAESLVFGARFSVGENASDCGKYRAIGRRRSPPPLWGRIKEGVAPDLGSCSSTPSAESVARPPTPARPRHRASRKDARLSTGYGGRECVQPSESSLSPDCPGGKYENPGDNAHVCSQQVAIRHHFGDGISAIVASTTLTPIHITVVFVLYG